MIGTIAGPWYCRNLGHRDALQSWRDRDADTVQRLGSSSVFTTTRGQTGKGREVPSAGTTRPEQGGIGWRWSAGLASNKVGWTRNTQPTLLNKEQGGWLCKAGHPIFWKFRPLAAIGCWNKGSTKASPKQTFNPPRSNLDRRTVTEQTKRLSVVHKTAAAD